MARIQQRRRDKHMGSAGRPNERTSIRRQDIHHPDLYAQLARIRATQQHEPHEPSAQPGTDAHRSISKTFGPSAGSNAVYIEEHRDTYRMGTSQPRKRVGVLRVSPGTPEDNGGKSIFTPSAKRNSALKPAAQEATVEHVV